MKVSILIVAGMLFFSACVYMPRSSPSQNSYHRTNLPPGQAKKIYGSPSAKPFAPGQNKKNKH